MKLYTKITYLSLFILHGLFSVIPIISFFTLLLWFVFFLFAFQEMRQFKFNNDEILVVLMVYSLPFSFRNLFGGGFDSLPISWFYLLGGCFFLNAVLTKGKLHKYHYHILISSIIIIALSIIPLVITPKQYIGQAFGQFISISFNSVIVVGVILKYHKLKFCNKKINTLKNAFFIGGFYTSLMLFFQWFLHYYFSYDNFGTINYYMMRQACAFIFSDVSFLSLYLSLIAFYCFRVFFKKHNFIMLTYMLVITLGMLLSSARTGLFVLFVFIFIYVFFKQKNIINKVFLCLILLIFSYVFLQFFYTIRAESNLLSDSGRFQGYLRALSLLFDRPFIGYGFSRDYISSLMGCSIPHFSFLQYAIHGGILYSLVLLYNQYCIFKYAVVKKSFYVWQHAMILIGCCFIPDIFASRFLTMIILLIIIVTKRKINLLSLSYTKL